MIIYPAIDLRKGRCVRLQQGSTSAETVFADDPARAASRWVSEGAEWLHIVNLDGALGEEAAANLHALERIVKIVNVPIQFGGGLRSLVDIQRALDLGVSRIVLGTVAVTHPDIVTSALVAYGAERVAVGIDAREGKVVIHGWQDASELGAVELAQRMARLGVERIIYTDVGRDGMLTGVNIEATSALAQASGLSVIASGGVSSLQEIRLLKELEPQGIEGVIVGMALYRGALALPEALQTAKGDSDAG